MTERATRPGGRLGRRLVALMAPASLATLVHAQGAIDGMWEQSQRDLLPRLNAALEMSPSYVANDWSDPAGGLSGTITVFPAVFGQRPCRRFRVTVSGAAGSLTGEGVRCREAAGLWMTTEAPDRVVTLDPAVRQLQQDLHRLAYYDGPVDGAMSPSLRAAVASFPADEEVTNNGDATTALRDLAAAAVARIPPPGRCPDTDGIAARAVVCGTVR